MPPRCFVVTLGFHEDVALRRLHESSAKRGDRVVVLSGPPNPGSDKAFQLLRVGAARMGVDDVHLVSTDPSDPPACLVAVAEALARLCGGRELVLELGGGLRYLGAAAILACSALGLGFSVESMVEHLGTGFSVPRGVVEFSLKLIDTRDSELLALLASGVTDVRELSARMGVGEKTVVNRLSELRRRGLVEKRGRGSPELTRWGAAAARLAELRASLRAQEASAASRGEE